MLQRDWKGEEEELGHKFHYSNKDIGLIFRLHLKWSNDRLSRVKYFVDDILSELKGLSYSEPSKHYPTISIGDLSSCSPSSTFSQLCSPHESSIADIMSALEE